jgi:hypothetical protein
MGVGVNDSFFFFELVCVIGCYPISLFFFLVATCRFGASWAMCIIIILSYLYYENHAFPLFISYFFLFVFIRVGLRFCVRDGMGLSFTISFFFGIGISIIY